MNPIETKSMDPSENQDVFDIYSSDVQGGWRLDYFEAYNWGSFHQRVAHLTLDRQNTLLTGDNAAGKSTLADGIMTLLVPTNKRNYNAASGEVKQDRSELDYVRGHMGTNYDPELDRDVPIRLREPDGAYYTVLLAVFRGQNPDKVVSLAQILWVKSNGEMAPKSFIVSNRALTIKGDLSNFQQTGDIRDELKRRGFDVLSQFKDYSEKFHRALGLNSAHSPMNIFNQTVAVKNIKSLTQFIRDYMVDDSSALKLFEDLKVRVRELRETYALIKMQKEQLGMLETVTSHVSVVQTAKETCAICEQQRSALDAYFARIELKLRISLSEENARQLESLRAENVSLENEIAGLSAELSVLQAKQSKSPQGTTLAQWTAELANFEGMAATLKANQTRFQRLLMSMHPTKRVDSAEQFAAFMGTLPAELKTIEGTVRNLQKEEQDRMTSLADLKKEFDQNEKEVANLAHQHTSLREDVLSRRNWIADELGIKRTEMPFIAELIQVASAHEKWTPAIEVLLRSFSHTILVQSEQLGVVDAFVSANNMRGRIEYDPVDFTISSPSRKQGPDTVAGKVEIKPESGRFGAYILRELHNRFDHLCCEKIDDRWQNAQQALTITGLFKGRSGRRIKDDRRNIMDQKEWVMGWNNYAKLELRRQRGKELQAAVEKAHGAYTETFAKRRIQEERHVAAKNLSDMGFTFAEIDAHGVAVRIADLQGRIRQAKKDPALEKLSREIEVASKTLKTKASTRDGVVGRIAVTDKEEVANYEQTSKLIDITSKETPELENVFTIIRKRLDLPVQRLNEIEPRRRSLFGEYSREIDAAQKTAQTHTTAALAKMAAIIARDGWQHLHDDLGSVAPEELSADVINRFSRVQQRIKDDDIPKNEEKFRRLLQHNVIDDFNTFSTSLKDMEQAIRTRIDRINIPLGKVDFDRRPEETTYIQLVPEKTKDQEVKEFRFQVDAALKNIFNVDESEEAREQCFHQVNALVEELDKNPKRRDNVTDVRNWFDFKAQEYCRVGNRYKETYGGSTGKSGGEKYRLAATILATAIAYQYGIEIERPEGETFRFIMVDEALSRMGTEFCEYLFDLFNRFHLQVVIIHPGDAKLHLTEQFVSRYNVITKPGRYSSASNMSIHEFREFKGKYPPP
jgi:uncharacterized protein YPO0396